MRKFIFLLTIILLNCCGDQNMKTIDINLKSGNFIHLLFLNSKRGYLFSNNESFDNNYVSAEIFETFNGGYTWQLVKKYPKFVFSNIAPYYENNDLYFGLERNGTFSITSMNSPAGGIESQSLLNIFKFNNDMYFSSLIGITNIKDGNIIRDINIGNDACIFGNIIFTISSNKEFYFLSKYHMINGVFYKEDVRTSLNSLKIAKGQQDDKLIFAGKDGTNKVKVCQLNTHSNNVSDLYKTTNYYDIIDNLQVSNSTITCFVGKIEGGIVYYDILYSLDFGTTWNIKKFESLTMIKPNYLIDNTLYILNSNQMEIIRLK